MMSSATTTLSIPAKARITRELSLFSTSLPPGISCYTPNDTLTHLHAHITGPPDSPFEHGCFLLVIHIPMRYPFEPPRVRFLTPIHHPNIDSQGRICLDSLKSQPNGSWSPAISLPTLMLQIRALMGEPNAEDGLVADVTEQYKNNHESWFDEAKRMTSAEATDDKLIVLEQGYLKSILANSEEKNAKCSNCSDSAQVRRKSAPRILGRKILKENKGRSSNSMMDTDVPTISGNKRKDHVGDESDGPNKLRQRDTTP